jgi:hypothetical protein
MPVVFSQKLLFAKPLPFTQLGMVSVLRAIWLLRRQTTSPCLPHEKSSAFCLLYAIFSSVPRETNEVEDLQEKQERIRRTMHS